MMRFDRVLRRLGRRARPSLVALSLVAACGVARAQEGPDETEAGGTRAFSFAVVASDTAVPAATIELLRAIGEQPGVRFVVHVESSVPSNGSCSDDAIDHRRQALDGSPKAVVPVVAASEWASCGDVPSDPFERLQRIGDVLFGADVSLGQSPLPWLRQSALPRFHRNRENVRWQVGRVLFATVNLPSGNNGFRHGAGRNGEFEERVVSNRAWLDRTFRLATERKLRGIVLFVDAAPRFATPLGPPDLRSHERDGYFEWKLALRERVAAFKGVVLLVQGHRATDAPVRATPDHPLRDANGRPIEHLARIAAVDAGDESRWLRVEVDPADPKLFRVVPERAFDDPSGELYGPARLR